MNFAVELKLVLCPPKPRATGPNERYQFREDKYSNQMIQHFRNMLHPQNRAGFPLRNVVKRTARLNSWQIQATIVHYTRSSYDHITWGRAVSVLIQRLYVLRECIVVRNIRQP
jgi:hypothetical protein